MIGVDFLDKLKTRKRPLPKFQINLPLVIGTLDPSDDLHAAIV